ncbi:MAG: bifunctional riboflavin kinase/FAD synthetase [Thermodesulfobacteriota bacterium]
MKIIKDGQKRIVKDAVLTLGNFDGLHLGHRLILKKLTKRAAELGAPSIVYTFEPHPLKIVSPLISPQLITTLKDKIKLIEETGVDFIHLAKFTKEFAAKHPRDFVQDILVNKMNVREVLVGHDYKFGKGKCGTIDYLKKLGLEFGFGVSVIPAYIKGGKVVSSSRVRALVKSGSVRSAAALLGRDFVITGKVVRGKNLGKEIGFPTANLKSKAELIPLKGVYAVYVTIGGKRRKGVMNIGFAPTFEGGSKKISLEVHILNFNSDIYGREVEVSFIRRLRGEKVFKNAKELASRIKIDIKRARKILS